MAFCIQYVGDGRAALAADVHIVDAPHHCGFLRHDLKVVVLRHGVAIHTRTDVDPAVFVPMPDRPFHSFRVHLQVVLCDGRRDGQEQFAGACQCADLLLFEDHFDAEVAQLPYRLQQLHGVSREAGYRLRIDHIELAFSRILHHDQELRALIHTAAANASVRVDCYQFCIRVILEPLLPVLFLELVAVNKK